MNIADIQDTIVVSLLSNGVPNSKEVAKRITSDLISLMESQDLGNPLDTRSYDLIDELKMFADQLEPEDDLQCLFMQCIGCIRRINKENEQLRNRLSRV